MLETLDYTIRIGSTPIILYFDLYPMVVVISPLNSLIHDQIRRINTVRNRAAVLSFTRPMEADQAVEHAVLDQTNVDELRLKNGGYELVFLDQLLFDFDAFAGIDCLHDPL